MTFGHVNVDFFHFVISQWWAAFPQASENYTYKTGNQLRGQFNFKSSGALNDRNLQRSSGFASDPTEKVYSGPYSPMWFSLGENYNCPICTLPHQSLKISEGPEVNVSEYLVLNPLHASSLFPYLLKNTRKPEVLSCFQGV